MKVFNYIKRVLTRTDYKGKYNAIDVAKYLTDRYRKEKEISNLELNKLLYCLQKEYIQREHSALYKEETEAWKFGPVIPAVYLYFVGFGAFPCFYVLTEESKILKEDQEKIDKIIKEKDLLNSEILLKEATKEGWQKTYKSKETVKIIPKRAMRDEI